MPLVSRNVPVTVYLLGPMKMSESYSNGAAHRKTVIAEHLLNGSFSFGCLSLPLHLTYNTLEMLFSHKLSFHWQIYILLFLRAYRNYDARRHAYKIHPVSIGTSAILFVYVLNICVYNIYLPFGTRYEVSIIQCNGNCL